MLREAACEQMAWDTSTGLIPLQLKSLTCRIWVRIREDDCFSLTSMLGRSLAYSNEIMPKIDLRPCALGWLLMMHYVQLFAQRVYAPAKEVLFCSPGCNACALLLPYLNHIARFEAGRRRPTGEDPIHHPQPKLASLAENRMRSSSMGRHCSSCSRWIRSPSLHY